MKKSCHNQNVIPAKAGIQSAVMPMKIGISVRPFAIFAVVFLSLVGFVFVSPAQAEEELLGQCFCYPYSSAMSEQASVQDIQGLSAECQSTNTTTCSNTQFERCDYVAFGNSGAIAAKNKFAEDECDKRVLAFKEEQAKMIRKIEDRIGKIENLSGEATIGKFIPKCLTDAKLTGKCKSIDIFVILGINIANYLFAIIGALALLMFIYGGVILIISEGNQEKVKKGTDAMLAAVIGIIVVFSAYLLVSFLGDVVGLEQGFRLF